MKMRTRIRHWGASLVLSGTMGLLLLLACSVSVSAQTLHARVVSSDPKIGSTIAQPPSKVTVTAVENIKPGASSSNLFVYGPNGRLVSQGNAAVDIHHPTQMSIALKTDQASPQGIYIVEWKTVSADDGDAAQGAFTFTVSPVAAAPIHQAAPAKTAPAHVAAPAAGITRRELLAYLAVTAVVTLLIGVGSGFVFGRSHRPAVIEEEPPTAPDVETRDTPDIPTRV